MTEIMISSTDALVLAEKARALAKALDDQIPNASSSEEAIALSNQATSLRNEAAKHLASSILLRNNEAGLSIDSLGFAIDHCSQVVQRVGEIKRKIRVAAALVRFIPAIASGNVVTIVKAGVALNDQLEKIESGVV